MAAETVSIIRGQSWIIEYKRIINRRCQINLSLPVLYGQPITHQLILNGDGNNKFEYTNWNLFDNCEKINICKDVKH